jgi:alpha-ribazole phosphatase
MKLILVRHGETDSNVARRFQGHSDTPLNSTGSLQAERVAQALAGQPVEWVVSSDLQRAQDTAAAIASVCHVPMFTNACWREMNFGRWEGLTYPEIMEQDAELFQEWSENPMTISPPGGETLAAVEQRVKLAWQEIEQSKVEKTVLVAHGGSLQLLLCHLLDLPPTAYWQFRLDHASLTHIQIYPAGAILISLNDTYHLTN